MYNKKTTVCFSGHRNIRLPKTIYEMDNLKMKLYEEIQNAVGQGYRTFLFGACWGFDLLCAEMVILIKNYITSSENMKIYIIAIIPFAGQEDNWSIEDKIKYYNILSKCDGRIILSEKYTRACRHKINMRIFRRFFVSARHEAGA